MLDLADATDYMGLEPMIEDTDINRVENEDLGDIPDGQSKNLCLFFCPTEGVGERVIRLKVFKLSIIWDELV